MAMTGICAMCISMALNIRFKLYRTPSLAVNGICLAVWAAMFILFVFEEVFLTSTMAQLLPSHVQSFAESQRQVFVNIGGLLAFLCSGPAFQHIVVTCSVVIAVLAVCALMVAVNYSAFVHPVMKHM